MRRADDEEQSAQTKETNFERPTYTDGNMKIQ
jgi:hypothetical protein